MLNKNLIYFFVIILVFTFSKESLSANVLMFAWNNNGLIEQGFRDGLITKFPETRFYTFGCNRDNELVKMYLERSQNIKDKIYFATSLEVLKTIRDFDKKANIIFVMVQDPEDFKIVASNSSPMVPITGVSTKIPILEQIKTLEKIKPFKTLGVLGKNSDSTYLYSLNELERLSVFFNYKLMLIDFPNINFPKNLQKNIPDALYIPLNIHLTDTVIKTINTLKIPTISEDSSLVEQGVLLALVIDEYKAGRFAANKAIKVLNGENIKKIPISFLQHFMVVVNLKTAKEINVNIPIQLLVIADKIIR